MNIKCRHKKTASPWRIMVSVNTRCTQARKGTAKEPHGASISKCKQAPVGFNYSSPFRLFCLSAASPRKNEGHRPIHCTKQRKGTRQQTMHMFDLLGLGNDVPCTCLIRWVWATKCQQMLHNRTQWLTGELKLSSESATVHSQLLRRDFVFKGKLK